MARVLFALLVAIVATTIYFFSKTWLPRDASYIANPVDHQLLFNLVLLGLIFCAVQLALGAFVWRYRSNSADRAISQVSQPSARTELIWLTVAAVLFLGLNVAGEVVWKQPKLSEPFLRTEPARVEVQAVQFRWYFRYPGPDGKFGRTKAELVDASAGNPLGIDYRDPSAADDLVSSTLVVAAAADTELTLRAQDVIHSFFVPSLRVKQDAMPGQTVIVHLSPGQPGEYDIACAQLCGMGHYQMNAKLKVVSETEYKGWLAQQSAAKATQR